MNGVETLRVSFKGFVNVIHVEVKAAGQAVADRTFPGARRAAEPE